MKVERSDVEFPIWRKKVDKSLFEHNGTTVPLGAQNVIYMLIDSNERQFYAGEVNFSVC
jgi:hypothetical protein